MPSTVKAAVSHASEQLVIRSGAGRIGVLHNAWPFLPSTSNIIDNKALDFAVSLYGSHPLSTAVVDELADYLSLACCCHALDGWRYLSQAVLALLSGARNHAVHLAYYAELRGALSILAGSGIGILNDQHFTITDQGQVYWFDGPTHTIVWSALNHWVELQPNALKVIECFEALDISATDWAGACNAARSLDEIGKFWLKDWSIDLRRIGEDRKLRNEASYRPDLRSDALNQLSRAEVEFVNHINDAYVPIGSGRFESIDLMVINDLCKKACMARFGSSAPDPNDMIQLWSEISSWISINKAGQDAEMIVRKVQEAGLMPAGQIMDLANPSNRSVLGVISRALLLLRLAEALKRRLYNKMRLLNGNNEWLRDVVCAYGICANLCDSNDSFDDYSILDADRVAAQESLEDWLTLNPLFNPHKMWTEIPGAILDLCRFERIGVLAATS